MRSYFLNNLPFCSGYGEGVSVCGQVDEALGDGQGNSLILQKEAPRSWIFQIAYTQAFLRRRKLKATGFYLSTIPDNEQRADSSPDSYAEYDHTVEGLFG